MDHAAAGCTARLQRLEVATKIRRTPECLFAFETTLQHELWRSGDIKAWTARHDDLRGQGVTPVLLIHEFVHEFNFLQ